MTLSHLIRLSRAFADLGNTAGEQLVSLVNGEPLEDQNSAMLQMIDSDFLELAEHYQVDGVSELRGRLHSGVEEETGYEYMEPSEALALVRSKSAALLAEIRSEAHLTRRPSVYRRF